jgi:hypothetical protein
MSTKIYGGFKFANPDLTVIHSQLMDWRNELRPLHQQAANAFVAEIAIHMFDTARMRPGSHTGETPLMEAISALWDRQAKVTKIHLRDPLVDFEFAVSLMPFEGQVYGIAYTEQREWHSLWMAKPFIVDFAYWDNTDPPEDLPDEEWQERDRAWDSIFKSAIMSAPSMAGFTAECTHDTLMPDTENVVAALPAFEDRVTRWAKKEAANKLLQKIASERGPSTSADEHTEYYYDAMQVLRSAEGEALIESEKPRIAGILEPKVTREMLLEKL